MRRNKRATMKYTSFLKPWGETSALHMKKSFILQPLHMLDVTIIFSKCLANWHAARLMDSCQNNPSPSDPMDSVCRHFPPLSLTHMLDVAIIFSKCLANWHASRPMDPWHGDPSPSDPIESVCRHFPLLSLYYDNNDNNDDNNDDNNNNNNNNNNNALFKEG